MVKIIFLRRITLLAYGHQRLNHVSQENSRKVKEFYITAEAVRCTISKSNGDLDLMPGNILLNIRILYCHLRLSLKDFDKNFL